PSDYAREGIVRGRSVVALEYADGVLFVAENPSATLHKISEIYDRIAFAAVGKYSEFEDLRISGIRLADVRGYSYGREDVSAKALANAYSQALSAIFTQQMKPDEVGAIVSAGNAEPAAGEPETPGPETPEPETHGPETPEPRAAERPRPGSDGQSAPEG